MLTMKLFGKENCTFDLFSGTIINKIYKECLEMSEKNTWVKPEHSKSEINNAGFALADPTVLNTDEYKEALSVVNNWRASHSYPLQVIYSELLELFKDFLVVQRLKRLESITGKLERFPKMNLYRMQDLGGCRIIVDDLDQVYEAVKKAKRELKNCTIVRETDYINEPKNSGYRCYHMIVKFHSDDKIEYNKNMLLEIQFRTRLQHKWATAVEMMGLFTKSNLKSSQGSEDILRFFVLASSAVAMYEGTALCPNTTDDLSKLLNEIKSLDKEFKILDTLEGLNKVTDYVYDRDDLTKESSNQYYVLILKYDERKIYVQTFNNSEIKAATKFYYKIENQNDDSQNVVLVSAKSLKELREAYPNYFVDIGSFVTSLKEILRRYGKSLMRI